MMGNKAIYSLKDLKHSYERAQSRSALQEVLNVFITLEDLETAIQALEEIQQYRDAEEQGLLLKLPCKVGTELFAVLDKCRAMIVSEEDCDDELSCLKCPYRKQFVVTPVSATKDVLLDEYFSKAPTYIWGKTLFATKEEAEQALTEMKEV